MNLIYGSPRTTKDIDFTTTLMPEGFADYFSTKLDHEMRTAAAWLGYVDLLTRVQSGEMRPPDLDFPWPTLRMRIGIARRGTHQNTLLDEGRAIEVLRIDVSFNEPVFEEEQVLLAEEEATILSYGIHELIAEKLRALIQQDVRDRQRGQDVYDIARLVKGTDLTHSDRKKVLDIFRKKAAARNLDVSQDTIMKEQIENNSRSRYETMALEPGGEDLDFDRDMAIVRAFYRSLPWA